MSVNNNEQLSWKEQQKLEKQKEKEKRKQLDYARSMISRAEAYSVSQKIAEDEVGKLAQFIREPLRVNMAQTMAIVELLLDKGIIKDTAEFQVYLDRVQEKVQQEAEKVGETDGEKEGSEQVTETNGNEQVTEVHEESPKEENKHKKPGHKDHKHHKKA